jgi:hypothetical protein
MLKKNVRDFVIIDDLYTELINRNQKLSQRDNDSIDAQSLRKINNRCLELVKKALRIKWDNYV